MNTTELKEKIKSILNDDELYDLFNMWIYSSLIINDKKFAYNPVDIENLMKFVSECFKKRRLSELDEIQTTIEKSNLFEYSEVCDIKDLIYSYITLLDIYVK